MSNAEIQELRAFVSSRKRSVEAAAKRYDISAASNELRELAAPLLVSDRFPSTWKVLYLEMFYREVVAFLLNFVVVHLELCFSEQDREQAFNVFFDCNVVPSSRIVGALTSTLSAMNISTDGTEKTSREDREASLAQCVRLLEKAVLDGGIPNIVLEMLALEQQVGTGSETNMSRLQVLVSQLASLPDLIFNRQKHDTPATFRPPRYFLSLCEALFDAVSQRKFRDSCSRTYRLFADKLTRIGQAKVFVQSWMRSVSVSSALKIHRSLFESLPESCYEQILIHIASESVPCTSGAPQQVLAHPKYRLLAFIPSTLCANTHFQFVVAHKLLLRKPMSDFYFWRGLVDALVQCDGDPCDCPLVAVFDVVLAQWSQTAFAGNTDYSVNASVCFFLRYSMQKLTEVSRGTAFMKQDWTAKLCKGVQDHMSHSVDRVRTLGMRVGESLSLVIATDKPLDFGLEDEDPLTTYGCPVDSDELEKDLAGLDLHPESAPEAPIQYNTSRIQEERSIRKNSKKHSTKSFPLDPDELVLSDDYEAHALNSEDESESSLDGADSESDMSLEAYDLHDDEEDLKTGRPLYLKDLIAGLLAEDDRKKTEAALDEVEPLLRRQPRDLHDKARDLVRALLRLEDKYSTPNFPQLRSQALASTCALAPAATLPYLCSQALEREQLLQNRLDVLQAMVAAAQELSDRGGDYPRPQAPKRLLHAQQPSDLATHTMQELKTRRWGYRRNPLVAPKPNAFLPYASDFFSSLLFGYVDYVRKHAGREKARTEIEQTFLAHLLHALAVFLECSGNGPPTLAMAKCLLEFAWTERGHSDAEVRRQVLFSLSRILLVVPPALLQQEEGEALVQIAPWLRQVQTSDPDAGCREAARLLSSFPVMQSPSSLSRLLN